MRRRSFAVSLSRVHEPGRIAPGREGLQTRSRLLAFAKLAAEARDVRRAANARWACADASWLTQKDDGREFGGFSEGPRRAPAVAHLTRLSSKHRDGNFLDRNF